MKSITIHDLDNSLGALIEQKAREKGLSLNKTVKLLLNQALGLEPGDNGARKADFAEFSGLWSKADQKQFERKTQALHLSYSALTHHRPAQWTHHGSGLDRAKGELLSNVVDEKTLEVGLAERTGV